MKKDKNLLVPINELSPHRTIAKNTLVEMINSLTPGPFLSFIQKNITYDVEILRKDINDKINTSTTSITAPLKNVTKNSSVYIFQTPNGIYIGSASNTFNRIGQHEDSLSNIRITESAHKNLLHNCSIKSIKWGIIYISPNYYEMRIKQLPAFYKLSLGETMILRRLNEFIIRILEQSIIDYYKPNFNNSKYPVLFTYNSWLPETLKIYDYKSDNSLRVSIRIRSNGGPEIGVARSISERCKILGVSRNMANRYIQDNKGFYSPSLSEKVTMGIVGSPLYNKDIIHRIKPNYKVLSLPGGPLESLQPYFVWAFKSNKTDFIGPFLNFTDAARTLNPSRFTNDSNKNRKPSRIAVPIKRANNLENLVKYEIDSFYIASNPNFPPYRSNPKSKNSPIYGKELPISPFVS